MRGLLTIATMAAFATGSTYAKPPAAAQSYEKAYVQAVKEGSFMVTWFDRSPLIRVDDTLTATATATAKNGFNSGEVVVSGPWVDGSHVWYETLHNPTDSEVKAAVKRARAKFAERKASLTAIPKERSWPLPSAGEVVDGDLSRRGPWPKSLPFPDDMHRYKRAAYTQSIYVLVNDGKDHIDPVHRLDLPNRDWHQSGGMLGIEGFRSDLYRNDVAERPDAWVGDIAVKNGHKVTKTTFDGRGFRSFLTDEDTTQNNRGWIAKFPDKSRFMDVLSKDGEVFEIRQREKLNGTWKSIVLYEDESNRPKGYTGLSVSCNSCHAQAGTGGYAVGLVPGGDGVLSIGFRTLEK